MNKYEILFLEWCDALLCAQINDRSDTSYGGFRCDADDYIHGRADNAIYPFVFAYTLTKEKKYLDGARKLLVFRRKLTEDTGAVHNDFTSEWRGITAFSAINLLKTLLYFGKDLPHDLRSEIEDCARASAKWVHDNMVIGFHANVNYYCAAAAVDALYDELYHDDAFRARAQELVEYALSLFTENGFLSGEAQPHDGKSPRGCLPIDVGYVVEESLPCLIEAATILGDEYALEILTKNARKLLDFMLPDGGWDNSFGVRNNKWTYYGSRTSDGVIGAFQMLAARDGIFREAAERTYETLCACTHGRKLYGGRYYYENGQPACIHHTFCHACALADAIREGIQESERLPLPCDDTSIGYKYYPEIDAYKIHAGDYLATVTGYDFATYTYPNGAAHAGGGTISLLYKQGTGAMIAGSVYDYRTTEKNNMQLPTGEVRHATLLMRAEYEKDGVKYATCLDKKPKILVCTDKGGVYVLVKARFYAAETQTAEAPDRVATFSYHVSSSGVEIHVADLGDARFILPIVKGTSEIVTKNAFEKNDIFFLTGGFAADEYVFHSGDDLAIKII